MKNFPLINQIKKTLKTEMGKLLVTEDQELNNYLSNLLERRLSRPSFSSSFIYAIARYIDNCAEAENYSIKSLNRIVSEKYLPFIIEVIGVINQLYGQTLNKKQRQIDHEQITQSFLATNLLKNRIYDYIDDRFDEEDSLIVQRSVRKVFRCIDVAQYFDRYDGYKTLLEREQDNPTWDERLFDLISLEAVEDILSNLQQGAKQKKAAIRIYFERSYLLGAALFRFISELLMQLMHYEGKERKNIIRFSECYGLLIQLVQDNGDFVSYKEIFYGDRHGFLNDLKNRTITLPILLHLDKKPENSLIRKLIEKIAIFPIRNERNEILKEMILSGALLEAVKTGEAIAKRAKLFLNPAHKAFANLVYLLSIAYYNRYYEHIYKAENFYKKTENKTKIYHCEIGDVIESSYFASHKTEIKETGLHYPATELHPVKRKSIPA